jgi:hypothetical protein
MSKELIELLAASRKYVEEACCLGIDERRLLEQIDAALAQPTAQAVPEGWELVPSTPSEEMVLRGVDAQIDKLYAAGDPNRVEDVRWVMTRACYAAMLAAAPEVKK